jgi:hypothetical protein
MARAVRQREIDMGELRAAGPDCPAKREEHIAVLCGIFETDDDAVSLNRQ